MYELSKLASAENRRINFIRQVDVNLRYGENALLPSSGHTAVVVDMSCNNSSLLLQLASENRLFDQTRHWLLFLAQYHPLTDFEAASDWFEPQMFDPHEYLARGTDSRPKRARISELNAQINEKLLKLLSHQKRGNPRLKDKFKELELYVTLSTLVDSEVTLAVPLPSQQGYDLYEMHRKTHNSKMVIVRTGHIRNGSLQLNIEHPTQAASLRRLDFQGAVVKATIGLLYLDYFSQSDALTDKTFDLWAMLGGQLSSLIEERLNYRMLIKVFDDYGWFISGQFTGMVGFFYDQQADMMAGGLLITPVRMPAVHFVASVYPAPMGLLFLQPALSQVTNIFVLPFSMSVWLCIGGLILSYATALYFNFRATNIKSHIGEVLTFFTAAACQQGCTIQSSTMSGRLTMICFLLSSLFLLTSYSANITALLQSPSSAIKTVKDVVDSSIDVAVVNLPYIMNLVKEDQSLVMQQLRQKTILPKNADDVYMNVSEGVRRLQAGLFAYQAEHSAAFKLISERFKEAEKCALSSIPALPMFYSGPAVAKKSPFKEILQHRYRWLRESGMTSRAANRFIYKKPKCTALSSRFTSIGLLDTLPLFLVVAYGVGLSVIILAVELLHKVRGRAKNQMKTR